MGDLIQVFNPRPWEWKDSGGRFFTQEAVVGDELLTSDQDGVACLIYGK